MASLKQSNVIYSDMRTDFAFHPITKDLIVITNEASVTQAIVNLLLTNYYERPYSPTVGGNLTGQMFELISPTEQIVLINSITETIQNFEPRAIIIDVQVAPDSSNYQYLATITFSLLNSQQPTTVSVSLTRVR